MNEADLEMQWPAGLWRTPRVNKVVRAIQKNRRKASSSRSPVRSILHDDTRQDDDRIGETGSTGQQGRTEWAGRAGSTAGQDTAGRMSREDKRQINCSELMARRALIAAQDEYSYSLEVDRAREIRRRQVFELEGRRRVDRRNYINAVPEITDGFIIQLKYSDGRIQKRSFSSSQPFQDLVAFVGMDEMASEIFSLQPAMSSNLLLSTLSGTILNQGISSPQTLFVLWMSGDEVLVCTVPL
nr:uncharacterized protein LOC111839631 [Paramormyrops kingsleyae]